MHWLTIFQGYKKWLKPDNVYQLGRSSEKVESSNFVYFNQIYISKEHLQIETKLIDKNCIYECGLKTPLLVKIQSRAITRINGEKVKLRKDEPPFVKDYTHKDLNTITFKEENAMKITIEWIPLNICRYTKQIMVGGNLDSNPLTDELLKLFDNGIDLRIAKNPFSASHYLTLSDHLSYGLKISLLRGIPILNTDWTDFIIENKESFERWFLELDPSVFLPYSTKDNRYLIPNKERTTLLKSSMFVIFHDTKDKLSKWIGSLGGKVFKVDISAYYSESKIDENLLSIIKTKVKEAECDKCFLMEFSDYKIKNYNQIEEALSDFAHVNSGKIIKEAMLYESVVNISTSNLLSLNLDRELKRSTSAEIVCSQPQRKRRKFKKVGITDFFDFKPPIKTESLFLDEAVDKIVIEDKPMHNSMISASISASSDNTNTVLNNSGSPVVHTDVSINELPNKNNDESNVSLKRQVDSYTEEGPRLKKKKEEKKIGKFVPQISLLDAIKSTKERAKENAREELGIDEKENDGLNENLKNLAIVETFNVSRRRRELVPIETRNTSYKERKNFKTFRKNKPLENDKRCLIDMQPVLVGDGISNVFIESNKGKENTQRQLKLMDDIGGVMSEVNGYKPYSISLEEDNDNDVDSFSFQTSIKPIRESTLFVPEDDTQTEYNPTPSTSGYMRHKSEVRNAPVHDDDDDDEDLDDDDDQPKFAFTRA